MPFLHFMRSAGATLVILFFAAAAAAAPAQGTDVPERSRAAQLEGWGLTADPGDDPDPESVFLRNGEPYKIQKFEKKWTLPSHREGWIRPFRGINISKEIYRQDETHVWAWIEQRDYGAHREGLVSRGAMDVQVRYTDEKEAKFLEALRPEFELREPPSSGKVIRFEEASNGLPTAGLWRNSLAVADMNGDGFADLILPPQRSALQDVPSIYLGDGKGNWRLWEGVEWPVSFDYGSVVVGDLNRDGHLDLVFGIHLDGVAVFLGDGKGKFREAADSPPPGFGTRRVRLADIDGDGWLDIVAISEGPTPQSLTRERQTMLFYMNRNKGERWEPREFVEKNRGVAGDWLAIGNLNGDRYPDIVGSGIYFAEPDPIYLSKGKLEYEAFGRGFLPFESYTFAVATGRFRSKKTDEALLSFFRVWPRHADPTVVTYPEHEKVSGIEMVSWDKGKPQRRVIVAEPTGGLIGGLAAADFDGDGKLDFVYTSSDPRRLRIMLGDGKGGFASARIEGLELDVRPNYDVSAEDVNGDGLPDIILMYEDDKDQRDGSVRVFLNRGVASGAK
jgi:hypothetical protein